MKTDVNQMRRGNIMECESPHEVKLWTRYQILWADISLPQYRILSSPSSTYSSYLSFSHRRIRFCYVVSSTEAFYR